jgi:hypothetical protein
VSFVHEDPDFGQLLEIVARETGIAAALIEKDYRVTHTSWARHRSGLDIRIKGGTSLSKGFALIQRFSEDLDLMIQHGSVCGLPDVTSGTSTNKGPVAKRRALYDTLVFLTNHLAFGASTSAAIYKDRWQVELFFKALEQNLKVKTFVGTSPSALRTQIWTALIAILLLKHLQFRSKLAWALSNLVALLRWNLFTYRDLRAWLDEPFDTPPLEPDTAQLLLPLPALGQLPGRPGPQMPRRPVQNSLYALLPEGVTLEPVRSWTAVIYQQSCRWRRSERAHVLCGANVHDLRSGSPGG